MKKSNTWNITVMKESIEMVIFNEPVTANEAYKKFLEDDFEDILDSNDTGNLTITKISE